MVKIELLKLKFCCRNKTAPIMLCLTAELCISDQKEAAGIREIRV